jgi:hypothetical protein
MSETQSDARSFRFWYGGTMGKWRLVSQVAAWLLLWLLIPVAYAVWRFGVWAGEWSKTHGQAAAARSDATHTWVGPTVTKRGRFRRGYWRQK